MRSKVLKSGLAIIVVGTAPLLLYIIFGPADGNPIGLGLLATASWVMGGACVVIALIARLFARS